jgi:serine/threonine protein kinase
LVERTMKCSRGSIQESLARFYFAQVAAGVSYLHKCGVAHLDIKPENLLLTSTGQVKICDFGMARVVASAATNGAPFSAPVMLRGAVGTVMYMAPEVHGKRRFNPFQADAYSLGVVLFMLLTGQHMYETPALSDARFAMVISGPDGIKRLLAALGLLRKLSVEAVELLCHLISADPSLRFTADEVLAHEWFTPMRAPVQVTSTSLSASAAPLASPAASVPPAASAPYVASAADTDAKQKPVGSQSASGSCSDRKTDGAAIVPMDESSDFDASSSCSATSPRVRMTIASSAAPRLDSLDGVVITSASDAAAPGATAVSIKSAFQPRRSTRFRAPRCFRDTSRSEKRVAV